MNDAESILPVYAQIQEFEIKDTYKDQALETIKKLVRGNKTNPDDIKLEAFEGKTLRFGAQNLLTLVTKQDKVVKSGKYGSAVRVETEEGANAEMHKAYRALENDANLEHAIREIIFKRKEKGFGKEGNDVLIPMDYLKKEFVIHESCRTCRAEGVISCLPCGGHGRVTCTRCNGSGTMHCTHCGGAQMVPVPGDASNKMQCPVCHGRGYTGCTLCSETGEILCNTCAGRGVTQCPNCQGTAWTSTIFTQDIQVLTKFIYPADKLPEKVVAVLETPKADMNEHAIILIITDAQYTRQWKEMQLSLPDSPFSKILQDGNICFPILYDVTLPYGHIEYSINGKSYYTFLFGQKAMLTHVSPFLDDLIQNGMRKLEDAAAMRGDVQENLIAAGEYRTVKEGIAFTAIIPSLSKAKIKLKAANPLGLSDSAIEEIISRADRALKNITKKPRIVAMSLAAFGYTAGFAAYFLFPLHNSIAAHLPNIYVEGTVDALILGTAIYIGMTAIQGYAHTSLKKTMGMLIPSKIKTAPPKLGKIFYWNIAAATAIFAATLEASRHIAGVIPPEWYSSLL